MAEVKWIKITTNMFEDEKIDFIESLPEADAILVIWVKLLAQAGKNNTNGFIFLTEKIPYTEEMLSHKFRRPLSTVRLALKTLEQLEMIIFDDTGFIKVSNWEKHQNIEGLEKIREQNRIRQAKYRDKQRELQDNKGSNVNITLCNAIEQEQELELEQELDIEQQHREPKVKEEDVVVVLDKKINIQEAKRILKTANGDMEIIKSKYEIAKSSGYKNLVGFMIKAISEDWRAIEQKGKAKSKYDTKFHNFDQRSDKYDEKDLEKVAERKRKEAREKMKGIIGGPNEIE